MLLRLTCGFAFLSTALNLSMAAEKGAVIRLSGAQITAGEEIKVPAREVGVLQELRARHGQKVKEGDVLAQLDDAQARLEASEAGFEYEKAKEAADSDVDLRAAKKAHEVAQAELNRSLEAVEKFAKSISKTELDRLRLTMERAQLAIEQAELQRRASGLDANLRRTRAERAQNTLDRHRLISPVTGVVVQIDRERGEWVEPGTPVFHVLRMDRLRCEVRTDASTVTSDMQGRPARVTVRFPDRDSVVVNGRLAFVDPRVSPIQKDTLIWAEFDNPHLLIRPGLEAELEILPPEPNPDAKTTAVIAPEKR